MLWVSLDDPLVDDKANKHNRTLDGKSFALCSGAVIDIEENIRAQVRFGSVVLRDFDRQREVVSERAQQTIKLEETKDDRQAQF